MNIEQIVKKLSAVAKSCGWDIAIVSEGEDVIGVILGEPEFVHEAAGDDASIWSSQPRPKTDDGDGYDN